MVILLLACGVGRVHAQAGRALSAWVVPLGARLRSGGPVCVDIVFVWNGRGLLEGRLEASLLAGGSVVGRYESPELVLKGGRETFRMMFPAIGTAHYGQPEVELRLRTAKGVLELGRSPLGMAEAASRSFTIGVTAAPAQGRPTEEIVRSLRLNPVEDTRVMGPRALSCQPAYLNPEDFPTHPLACCTFDLVLLEGRGFSLLREKQLEALRRWVEAGGSVCVIPGGELTSCHVDFLNALSPEELPCFRLNAQARVEVLREPRGVGGLFLLHSGLGRAVVVTSFDLARQLDSKAWRQAVCFLWKVRLTQQQQQIAHRTPFDFGDRDVTAAPPADTPQLVRGLMPASVRLIPFWAVGWLLVLFVLVIGPGDYFLLGLLRRRKFTWVLFPALSVAMMLSVVWVSNHFMGSTDRRSSLTFVDVGRGGKVLRTNRYELLFAGAHRDVVTEAQDSFLAPIAHGLIPTGRDYDPGETGPVSYVGHLPTRYAVRQRVRKWAPQLNRVFSTEPRVENQTFRWDAVDVPLLSWAEGWKRLKEKLAGDGPFEGGIYVMNGDKVYQAHRAGLDQMENHLTVYVPESESDRRGIPEGERRSMPFGKFLWEACAAEPQGLFSLVSQVSPTASGGFEDLPILDSSDTGQWLVMVVTRSGSDTVVYRRVYHGE